jgi:hypothetical protein
VGGFAHQRQARRPVALDREPAQGHHPARALDPHGAEHRLRLPFHRERQGVVGQRVQALRLGGVRDPDQTRASTGQRHERERSLAGMELRRGLPVVAGVAEDRGQGGLRIGPGARCDACRLPKHRVAPVGRHREGRIHGRAAGEPDAAEGAVSLEAGGLAGHERDALLGFRRGGETRDQPRIGDVPAEGLEPDLARME